MMKLNDDDFKELGKGLGPLGWGIWYICAISHPTLVQISTNYMLSLGNAVAPEDYGGVELSGWCIAKSRDTLIFMYTNGYTMGYLDKHGIGNTRFWGAGYSVKSRDSDAKFMVLKPNIMYSNMTCDEDEMIEYARRWGGYRIEGEERQYYMELIEAAENHD